jgi:hypothetical protein
LVLLALLVFGDEALKKGKMKRKGCIYALCNKAGMPYYVGKTVQSAGTRLGEHRRESTTRRRDSACHKMTKHLIERGQGPAVWVLQDGIAAGKLSERERFWIAYGQGAGWTLLNYTGGGNGATVLDPGQIEKCRRRAAAQPRDHWQRFLSPLEGFQDAMAAGESVPW